MDVDEWVPSELGDRSNDAADRLPGGDTHTAPGPVLADLDPNGQPWPGDEAPGTLAEVDRDAPTTFGDPAAALRWSAVSPDEGLCAVTAVGMVASRTLGVELDQSAVVALAERLGFVDDAGGTTLRHTRDLLEQLGVPARIERSGMDEVRSHLRAGRGIILAVDGRELGGSADGDVGRGAGREGGADHAIVLVGIDDARGVAFVHDPGRLDGAGLEVPLAHLDDAWDDGGRRLAVVTLEPPHPATTAAPAIVLEPILDRRSGRPERATYLLLPVTLAAAALRPRRHTEP